MCKAALWMLWITTPIGPIQHGKWSGMIGAVVQNIWKAPGWERMPVKALAIKILGGSAGNPLDVNFQGLIHTCR